MSNTIEGSGRRPTRPAVRQGKTGGAAEGTPGRAGLAGSHDPNPPLVLDRTGLEVTALPAALGAFLGFLVSAPVLSSPLVQPLFSLRPSPVALAITSSSPLGTPARFPCLALPSHPIPSHPVLRSSCSLPVVCLPSFSRFPPKPPSSASPALPVSQLLAYCPRLGPFCGLASPGLPPSSFLFVPSRGGFDLLFSVGGSPSGSRDRSCGHSIHAPRLVEKARRVAGCPLGLRPGRDRTCGDVGHCLIRPGACLLERGHGVGGPVVSCRSGQGHMKVLTRSSDWEKDRAMDIDHPLYRALSSGRKRVNGEMDDYRRSDEIAVRTPPTYSRTPVHLRLSMNRRDTSPYDAEYDDAEYDDAEPQDDVRKYLSRSTSRKDRSSYEREEPQDDVRRYLSRSSSRKTRSMPEPEYEYYEDEPRKAFTRFPSKRDRPAFDLKEDGTRRQLSRSSSRKVRPEYEPEEEYPTDLLEYDADVIENGMEDSQLSERRKAMFEPLGPSYRGPRDGSPDSSLPPPDFDISAYPQGWVVGKKRKLVNVDVVESMRRIAVHEMNRKDREIGGLNEQLEEDSKTMEHLQIQLQQERTKRMHIERENNMLQSQINMLMTMINDAPEVEDEEM